MTTTTEIWYVLGAPRSGSTILERHLSRRSGVPALGEVAAVWGHGARDDRPCSCGEAFRDCPFWREVRGQVPALDDAETVREVALAGELLNNARVGVRALVPGAMSRLIAGLPSVWAPATTSLYLGIARVAGQPRLIDSSKSPAYAVAVAGLPDLTVRLVHLVRDPRSVAASWSRRVEVPPGVRPPPRRSAFRSALVWDATELGCAGAKRRLSGAVELRYEDLVADPDTAFERAIRSLGGAAVDAASRADVGYHSMSGNPGVRFHGRAPTINDRGAAPLSSSDRLLVDLVTAPLALARGYRRGGAAGRSAPL